MIKIGDKVKFLNDVGGGVVTGFIGKSMAKVENEEGFEIPYLISMLIPVDDPALNVAPVTHSKADRVVDRAIVKEEPEPSPVIIKGKDDPNFLFCFVPDNHDSPVGGELDLYLVNDSNFKLLFHFSHKREGLFKSRLSGTILPNSRERLESIAITELNDLPEYCFQILYFKESDRELYFPVTKTFKVTPVKFYKERSYHSTPFFENNAIIYKISDNLLQDEIDKMTEDDLKKVIELKSSPSKEKIKPKVVDPEILEVDLHIHSLIDNSKGLTNREILEIQLEKVEREMRAAIPTLTKRVVFIHGVGQGVLKQQISNLLKRKFPRYSFHDASFKEYGYGATMVILRRR